MSAILDLEPQTGGDDDHAEVGGKRASRKLGGLVTGTQLVGSDPRGPADRCTQLAFGGHIRILDLDQIRSVVSSPSIPQEFRLELLS